MLKNKKIFISGSSGAIGFSIANELLSNSTSCEVFLTGYSENLLKSTCSKLKNIFPSVTIHSKAADLSNHDEIINVIDCAHKKLGYIDILINCAGIFTIKKLTSEKYADISSIFHINLFAPIIFAREFTKGMIKNEWGRVINIGSSSCYSGYKNTTMYCSTKHGLLGFSRALHDELKEHNINVSCISPSSTKSRIGDATPFQDKETFLNPDDIAKVVYDILSLGNNACVEELLIKRREVR